ncbi:AGAP012450-PA [Anopheles gambiae str. PEST]|uniref:AGAP012450-PA n=1 Tax=Anopheles gambiae TaxID=7165 RepID=A7UTE4_ANOGA|nr:AGAP012450-PA [Anopheles gambiae str. PEST]
MPFSIVQTRGPKGYAESSIVPDSWVQGTSHKKNIFWPNVKGNIQHLITNDNSVPEEGWMKQECQIKRQGLSYEAADCTIMIISGESSTDSGKEPILASCRETTSYADMFSTRIVENSLTPIRVENEIDISSPPTSPLTPSLLEVDEYVGSVEVVPEEVSRDKTIKEIIEAQTNMMIELRNEQKQILKEQKKIVSRIGIIEVQLNTLLNHTEVSTTNLTGFDHPFKDNAEDLEKFEKDLDEEEYYIQIVSLLKQKINDKDINNRMFATLDALFDRSFLTKCTWTGISKSGTKIAMHSFKNVVNLFKCVGSTNLVPVTDETVQGFFMNRLKHALERSKAKGLRKSTSRKRKLI